MTPASLVIEVTARDIADGVPGKSSACPVALAVWRAVPEAASVIVGRAVVIILAPDRSDWALPPEAADLVRAVDNDRAPAPLTFTMTAYPEES